MESVYRIESDAWLSIINEARDLWESGSIELDENDDEEEYEASDDEDEEDKDQEVEDENIEIKQVEI